MHNKIGTTIAQKYNWFLLSSSHFKEKKNAMTGFVVRISSGRRLDSPEMRKKREKQLLRN